jgi:hypothetical protein
VKFYLPIFRTTMNPPLRRTPIRSVILIIAFQNVLNIHTVVYRAKTQRTVFN